MATKLIQRRDGTAGQSHLQIMLCVGILWKQYPNLCSDPAFISAYPFAE